jgi:hypothetical protein
LARKYLDMLLVTMIIGNFICSGHFEWIRSKYFDVM